MRETSFLQTFEINQGEVFPDGFITPFSNASRNTVSMIDISEIHRAAELEEDEIINDFIKMNGNKDTQGDNPPKASLPEASINIDKIHADAEAEEDYLKKKFWEWSLGVQSAKMVEHCVTEQRINDFEKITDEILNDCDESGVTQGRSGKEGHTSARPP